MFAFPAVTTTNDRCGGDVIDASYFPIAFRNAYRDEFSTLDHAPIIINLRIHFPNISVNSVFVVRHDFSLFSIYFFVIIP